MFQGLWQDIRHTARTLRASPGFTLATIVTLGLAMALNTCLFSVINGLVLRPLAVPHPEQIVALFMNQDGVEGFQGFSYPDYQDIGGELNGVADIFASTNKLARIVAEGKMDRAIVALVTPTYFSKLGIKPLLGRFISPDGGAASLSSPVAVLGYSYWQRRFNGSPDVIGKAVVINDQTLTVIGVSPPGFKGTFAFGDMAAYVPIGVPLVREIRGANTGLLGRPARMGREDRVLSVMARLKSGVTIDQVQPRLTVLARRLADAHPEIDKGIHIQAYPERLARPEPDPDNTLPVMAAAFTIIGGLVLLVACFNIANIFLVRATARQREMGIRAALGAGRGQLVRQHLTESMTLAVLGGAAGLAASAWVTRFLSALPLGADSFLTFDFTPDVRVYAFALASVFVTAFVVGSVPAFRVARTDFNSVLRGNGRGFVDQPRSAIRNILVGAQLAASLLLLVVAGLFLRSLSSAQHLDLGFNPNQVLNITIDAEELGFDSSRGGRFFHELGQRIAALPGVTSTAQAYTTPLRVFTQDAPVTVEGRTLPPGAQPPKVLFNGVTPGYFDTLQIPLLKGRVFTAADNLAAPAVAVVNQAFADTFWPHDEPLGKRFNAFGGTPIQVVGVTSTGQYEELFEPPKPFFYVPADQNYFSYRTIHIRTSRPPASMQREIDAQIHALAPTAVVPQVQTMLDSLEGVSGFFFYRFGAQITGCTGLLGLFLAVVGVYSTASYAAAQRTQEIGIRMALGAAPQAILKMVLRQSLLTIAAGLIIGLGAALAATRGLAALISGIRPTDPLTFITVFLLLSAVSLLACWVPARRATRVDPLTALRSE